MSSDSLNKYFELINERPKEFTGNEIKIITDKSILQQYESDNNCDIGVVYESPYHILVKDLVFADSQLFTYERLLKKNPYNSVVIIPIYQGKFVLLKQFRHPLRDFQLSFPRGFGEQDISILENVKKELSEELGCETLSCDVLGKVVADSGICGEKVSICLCNISNPTIRFNYEGIKDIDLIEFNNLLKLIDKNLINDAYTLSAISLYMTKHHS